MVLAMARTNVSGARGLCWCGSGQAYRRCHRPFGRNGPGAALSIPSNEFAWAVRPAPSDPQRPPPPGVPAPDYARTGEPDNRVLPNVRTPDEIQRLRRAGRHAADVLAAASRLVAPGVTTDAIDAAVYDECTRRGIYPSTLNYHGYPKSVCTSVNEQICHGIPDSRPLESGDIVNVDVTVYSEGVHGDCSATICVGQVNPVARNLILCARRCLDVGVAAVRPGRPLSDIGRAIETLATRMGCMVVRQFVGHGIGPQFHTGMQVLHHFSAAETTPMEPGMVFTVEPMINAGSYRAVVNENGWTAVTADLSRSAQFEHTVLVTPDGVEVLTAPSEPRDDR